MISTCGELRIGLKPRIERNRHIIVLLHGKPQVCAWLGYNLEVAYANESGVASTLRDNYGKLVDSVGRSRRADAGYPILVSLLDNLLSVGEACRDPSRGLAVEVTTINRRLGIERIREAISIRIELGDAWEPIWDSVAVGIEKSRVGVSAEDVFHRRARAKCAWRREHRVELISVKHGAHGRALHAEVHVERSNGVANV